jgi:hypothetical protein
MQTAADILLILCSLAPCHESAGVLYVPVPEVQIQMPQELWPRDRIDGQRVVFTPLPRGA